MNLLALDQFSDLGGAQQCLLDLLPGIRERGWNVTAAMPGEGSMFPRVRKLGFETARIDCGPFGAGRKTGADVVRFATQTPKLAAQIAKLARSADAIYVNGPRLLTALVAAGVTAPVVFHSHSYLLPGASRRLAGWALRRLKARVIANCRFVADVWKPYLPHASISVVYNAIAGPPSTFERKRPPDDSPRVFGCIGRIAPEKGQMELVEVAGLVNAVHPDWRFVIHGEPLFSGAEYEQQVRAAAADLPVEFEGWTADVYEALAGIDVLLVPSAAHEATTRVILEAFAAGVPVIAFRSGGIPEIVRDDVNGWLAGSVTEMAAFALRRRLPPIAPSTCTDLAGWRRQVLDAIAATQPAEAAG